MRRRGFTLLELMVVVALLVILAALGMSGMQGYTEDAQRRKCISNLRLIHTARESYFFMNPTATSLPEENGTAGLLEFARLGYFRCKVSSAAATDIPVCPCNGNYVWVFPRTQLATVPTCTRSGDLGHELKLWE